MGRILSIDYGRRRTGLAVTDLLALVPGGLCTVPTAKLISFVLDYCIREGVTQIVLGSPRQMNGQESETMADIHRFADKLSATLPGIPIEMEDERFTSVLAQRTMREAGLGQHKRRDKALVDELSAVIILQSYLDRTRGSISPREVPVGQTGKMSRKHRK